MAQKLYINTNVRDALMKRLALVFAEFDNIVVAFSGGKDSGLLLNLVIKYMRDHGITRKISVFHQDFEAQYTATTEYVERTMTANLDLIDPYWICLPMSVRTAASMYEQYWTPWNPAQEDIWVRPMPQHDCVINLANQPMDYYVQGMHQEQLARKFAPWLHRHKNATKTICLLGIRTDESMNRFRAVATDKEVYKGCPWTTKTDDETVWSGCPLYDWGVEDVWVANAKFGFDYNRLYDLFHFAGLSLHEMRVASPFNDFAIDSLKLYRVIEPNIWARMVGRVNGANFAAIYGGTEAVAWKSIRLPHGHTWRSYVEFLLKTLPDDTRASYEEKFATSIKFWAEKGGVLSAETIDELRAMGIPIEIRGQTNYKTDKLAVTFSEYPDDLDVKEFATVPSYKRMAICIMKNDHLCKYMGFSQTKLEADRRRQVVEKYMAL